ncbi:MAG: phosphate acetyltransferase, partial [Anaerolineae bacterium]|nr:phosphate acetyltransferase [Anaerolineae bacterium]
PQQLADIAVTTARSIKNLMGWQPRVALLSFSTRGSASHPLVDKVNQALALAQAKDPALLVDGEMQADAALVPAVADKKVGEGSPVAGKANILIFPDLNAANISSKLVQRLANAHAYGPILQGFQQPVSDLSRGASVEDVFGASIILSAGV